MWCIINEDNTIGKVISYPQPITINGVQYPENSWYCFTPQERWEKLTALDYRADNCPAGKIVTNTTYNIDTANFVCQEVFTLADDPSYLGNIQANLCNQVDAIRTQKRFTDFSVTLDASTTVLVNARNELDYSNINGIATSGLILQSQNSTATIGYRDGNNTSYALTALQAITLGSQVLAHVSAIYANSWSLKDSIMATTSVDAANAIDLNSGW